MNSELDLSESHPKSTPSCPLCAGREQGLRFSDKGYKVLVCRKCGLLFIHPYPPDGSQVHLRVASNNGAQIRVLDAEQQYRLEVQYYKKYFPLIAQECEKAKAILDVGCGTGYLLERLSIYPSLYRAGIELNSARAEFAKKISKCEIYQVPIEEFASPTKFDVIAMINVISHIPSFDGLFHSLRSLLAENGRLILKVGEMASDAQKGDLTDWGIPDHVHFLGLNTLSYICQKYRFQVVKHDRIPLSADIFTQDRWRAPSRTPWKNVVKQVVSRAPMALPILATWYDLTHGKRAFSSFIVLSVQS